LSSAFLQKKQKKSKKMMKNCRSLSICSLFVLFFLVSCSGIQKNCEIKPDLEQIGKSALENKENLSETELRAMKAACNF
jgi:hypothetical protein